MPARTQWARPRRRPKRQRVPGTVAGKAIIAPVLSLGTSAELAETTRGHGQIGGFSEPAALSHNTHDKKTCADNDDHFPRQCE